ncbi:MAG: hypothetical protein KJ687_06720 [Proteobacteria bacterium]|nr:hypothetical protein [Pseudomonadota bacterium]
MGDFLNQLRVLATTRDPQEFARILFSPLPWVNPQPESTDENQSEYVLVPARNPLNLFANPNQENENQRLDALNMYQLIGIIRAHREADIASNGITNADFRNYYEQSRQELNQAWQNYLRHPDNNGNRVNFMRSLRQHEQVLSDLRDVADF